MHNFSKSQLAARLRALEEVSVELIRTHNPNEILPTIVNKAIDLFVCDGGSLYLKGEGENLFFEVAVNRSKPLGELKRKLIPLGDRGLASYTFRTGKALRLSDVYRIPKKADYHFNNDFDVANDYCTRSVLIQPLKTSKGEVFGVLQLINRKDEVGMMWPSDDSKARAEMPQFSVDDERLLESFAAVASASLENSKLHRDIENLFEGFIRASVQAIESRDFVTRGHSDRVAVLTVDLARKVNMCKHGSLCNVCLSEAQISELRYAALLHDFGKIGVRESTLQKEEKLTVEQKVLIQARIQEFRSSAEIRALRELLAKLREQGRAPNDLEMAGLDKRIRDFSEQLNSYWKVILDLNRPTILNEDGSKRLVELSGVQCCDSHGEIKPLLAPEEILSLSILKGSLSESERIEIESHVTHSFEFLKNIPWTRELAGIPEIAYAHHERLDGTGYPRKIRGHEIPLQARMMSICDIYDALTAKDRPYKKAVPVEKALDILNMEAKEGKLDGALLQVFFEAKVYENTDFIRLNIEPLKKVA